MRITERLLWRYIDDECSPEEREHLESVFEVNGTVKRQYAELLKLHLDFKNFFKKRTIGQRPPTRFLATLTSGEQLQSVDSEVFAFASQN